MLRFNYFKEIFICYSSIKQSYSVVTWQYDRSNEKNTLFKNIPYVFLRQFDVMVTAKSRRFALDRH